MFPRESFRDGIKMVETNDLEPGIPEDKCMLMDLDMWQIINELELFSFDDLKIGNAHTMYFRSSFNTIQRRAIS